MLLFFARRIREINLADGNCTENVIILYCAVVFLNLTENNVYD